MSTDELLAKIETCKETNLLTETQLNLDNEKTNALVKNSMFFYESNTVYFYQLIHPTLHTITLTKSHLKELTKHLDSYNLIIDLSRTKRPKAEVREKIKTSFLNDLNIKSVYIYTGKNLIIKLAAKFILSPIKGVSNLIFVNSREEAIKLSQEN